MTLPIKIYSHAMGPNSWKINIICDELSIPYELEFKDNTTVKKPDFLAINPNGRYEHTPHTAAQIIRCKYTNTANTVPQQS